MHVAAPSRHGKARHNSATSPLAPNQRAFSFDLPAGPDYPPLMPLSTKHLMPAKEARAVLGIASSTIWKYAERGLLTPVYLFGKGRGKPTHYHREEVRLLSEGRMPELRTFQYRLRQWAKKVKGKQPAVKP
jgi:hypothetical protein